MSVFEERHNGNQDKSVLADKRQQQNDWEVVKVKLSSCVKIVYLLKLVVVELVVYLVLYYAINLVYRFVLDEEQREAFSKVVEYFDDNLGSFG